MAYSIKHLPQSWQEAFSWQRYQRLKSVAKTFELTHPSNEDSFLSLIPLSNKIKTQGTWYENQTGGEAGFMQRNFGCGFDGAFGIGQWLSVLFPIRFNNYYLARQKIQEHETEHPTYKIAQYDNALKKRIEQRLLELQEERKIEKMNPAVKLRNDKTQQKSPEFLADTKREIPSRDDARMHRVTELSSNANKAWRWIKRQYERFCLAQAYYDLYPTPLYLLWQWTRTSFLIFGLFAATVTLLAIAGPVLQTGVCGGLMATVANIGPITWFISHAISLLHTFPLLHFTISQFSVALVVAVASLKILLATHALCFDDRMTRLWPFIQQQVMWQFDTNENDNHTLWEHTQAQIKNRWCALWQNAAILRLSSGLFRSFGACNNVDSAVMPWDDNECSNNKRTGHYEELSVEALPTQQIILMTLANPIRWFHFLLKLTTFVLNSSIDVLSAALGRTIGCYVAAAIKAVLYLPFVVTTILTESLVKLADMILNTLAQLTLTMVYWPIKALYLGLAKTCGLCFYFAPIVRFIFNMNDGRDPYSLSDKYPIMEKEYQSHNTLFKDYVEDLMGASDSFISEEHQNKLKRMHSDKVAALPWIQDHQLSVYRSVIINRDHEALPCYEFRCETPKSSSVDQATTVKDHYIVFLNGAGHLTDMRANHIRNLIIDLNIKQCLIEHQRILGTESKLRKRYHGISYDPRGATHKTKLACHFSDLVADGISQVKALLQKGIPACQIQIYGLSIGGFQTFWIYKHFRDRDIVLGGYADRTLFSTSATVNGLIYQALAAPYGQHTRSSLRNKIAGITADVLTRSLIKPIISFFDWEANAAKAFGEMNVQAQQDFEYSNCKSDELIDYHRSSMNRGLKVYRTQRKLNLKHQYANNSSAYLTALTALKKTHRARKTVYLKRKDGYFGHASARRKLFSVLDKHSEQPRYITQYNHCLAYHLQQPLTDFTEAPPNKIYNPELVTFFDQVEVNKTHSDNPELNVDTHIKNLN